MCEKMASVSVDRGQHHKKCDTYGREKNAKKLRPGKLRSYRLSKWPKTFVEVKTAKLSTNNYPRVAENLPKAKNGHSNQISVYR